MACKILIIDNDEMMRIFLRDVFWVHGKSAQDYEVDTTKTIVEAREYLKDHAPECPDIIFLDLATPNASASGRKSEMETAIAFIREIKTKSPCKSKTSVVIFSSYDDPEIREEAKEAGAAHFLVKGEYMPKEIIDFVDEHYPHTSS